MIKAPKTWQVYERCKSTSTSETIAITETTPMCHPFKGELRHRFLSKK
jgi:hypothetical protein